MLVRSADSGARSHPPGTAQQGEPIAAKRPSVRSSARYPCSERRANVTVPVHRRTPNAAFVSQLPGQGACSRPAHGGPNTLSVSKRPGQSRRLCPACERENASLGVRTGSSRLAARRPCLFCAASCVETNDVAGMMGARSGRDQHRSIQPGAYRPVARRMMSYVVAFRYDNDELSSGRRRGRSYSTVGGITWCRPFRVVARRAASPPRATRCRERCPSLERPTTWRC